MQVPSAIQKSFLFCLIFGLSLRIWGLEEKQPQNILREKSQDVLSSQSISANENIVYVVSEYTHQLLRLDLTSGEFTTVFSNSMQGPHDIAQSDDGSIWIASLGSQSMVRLINGQPAKTIDTSFYPDGPDGVSVSSSGLVHVAISATGILRMDAEGNTVDFLIPPDAGTLRGVVCDSESNFFVSSSNKIFKYINATDTWEEFAVDVGFVHEISLTQEGNLISPDIGGTIREFSPSGSLINEVSLPFSLRKVLKMADGNYIVSDCSNSRVVIITPAGEEVASYSDPALLDYPIGLLFPTTEYVYQNLPPEIPEGQVLLTLRMLDADGNPVAGWGAWAHPWGEYQGQSQAPGMLDTYSSEGASDENGLIYILMPPWGYAVNFSSPDESGGLMLEIDVSENRTVDLTMCKTDGNVVDENDNPVDLLDFQLRSLAPNVPGSDGSVVEIRSSNSVVGGVVQHWLMKNLVYEVWGTSGWRPPGGRYLELVSPGEVEASGNGNIGTFYLAPPDEKVRVYLTAPTVEPVTGYIKCELMIDVPQISPPNSSYIVGGYDIEISLQSASDYSMVDVESPANVIWGGPKSFHIMNDGSSLLLNSYMSTENGADGGQHALAMLVFTGPEQGQLQGGITARMIVDNQSLILPSVGDAFSFVLQPTILGDANDNGFLDIGDALMISQFLAQLIDEVRNAVNADMNQNGRIDIGDALYISQVLAELRPDPNEQ